MTTALNPDQMIEMLRETVIGLVRREQADLTMRQLGVLLVCYLQGEPQTVRGLAEMLGVARSIITRALDRLEDEGLLRRKIDPADRRSVLTVHTRAGRAFLQELRQSVDMTALASQETEMKPEPR